MKVFCINNNEWLKYSSIVDIPEKYFVGDLKEVEISQPFEFKNRIYSVFCLSHKENYALVREISLCDKAESVIYVSEITCPFCGNENSDSWECGDGEDHAICEVCGSEYSWEKDVTVTYCSYPIKKGVVKILSDEENNL